MTTTEKLMQPAQKYEDKILGDVNIPYNRSWMMLPLLSAILVIGTLPPLNFWPLGFIALAPLYIFVSITVRTSWQKVAWGGFFFGLIFSAFLMTLTVLQFHWIEGAHLFSTLIKFSFIPLLLLMGIFASLSILASRFLVVTIARFTVRAFIPERMFENSKFTALLSAMIEFFTILSATAVWTLSEWIIRKCMFSIEYSIVGYPAHNTFFISLTSIGGVFLTVFFVTLINMSIGSLAYQGYRGIRQIRSISILRNWIWNCIPSIILIALSFVIASIVQSYNEKLLNTAPDVREQDLKIAIIQDQNREINTFGKESAGTFSFKTLEDLMQKANEHSPDMIIYPFAPWDGVIYDKEKDSKDQLLFDKNVFATSFQVFGQWQKIHTKKDAVFVTWATTYRDKKFYNEITFWRNGVLIGFHQKEHLFPFLDYTPAFAQSYGLYTTAVDGTAGTSTFAEKIYNIDVGALVCSEVTHHVFDSTSAGSDIILSIGSEAFFSNGVAGDLNVANSAFRAAESGKPVIRANRFGPSAFIDQTGNIKAYMPFGVTGVLIDTVSVPIDNVQPFYTRLFTK